MKTNIANDFISARIRTSTILHELGLPVHRLGYKQLCVAIPLFSENGMLSLTKELYPFIAQQFGCADWRSVEHTIRLAIMYAWENGDRSLWEAYFPYCKKPPSNKQFIATIAEYL